MSKSFPAIAVVGQSAGPARRPGEELFQTLSRSYPSFLTAHFHFENLSLIVLPMGNEHRIILWLMVHNASLKLDQWSIFTWEMRALLVRSGTSAAGRFSLKKTLRAAGIWIFPILTFRQLFVLFGSFEGGDVTQNIDLASSLIQVSKFLKRILKLHKRKRLLRRLDSHCLSSPRQKYVHMIAFLKR